MNTRELMNSSVSKAMIYILFGSLGPVMSSLQSEFYGLTSSFSQLAGSISHVLPTQGSHVSCQSSLRWLNGKVYQCMLKRPCKFATKHWHCNICKGVVTISITISNTAISLSWFQRKKRQLRGQYEKDLTMFHSGFCKKPFAKERLRKYIQIIVKPKKIQESILKYLKVNTQ